MVRTRVGAALVVTLALAAASPALAAWSHDPTVNTPISVGLFARLEPVEISDGAGGVIMAWTDQRSGGYDIYVQRLDQAGRKLWGATDVPLCTAVNNQQGPVICSDAAGGAIVAW